MTEHPGPVRPKEEPRDEYVDPVAADAEDVGGEEWELIGDGDEGEQVNPEWAGDWMTVEGSRSDVSEGADDPAGGWERYGDPDIFCDTDDEDAPQHGRSECEEDGAEKEFEAFIRSLNREEAKEA